MRLRGISLLPFLFLTGCFTPMVLNSNAKPTRKHVDYILEYEAFGQGVAILDVKCPNGIHSISTGETLGQSFVRGFTGGIIQDRTARIVCAK